MSAIDTINSILETNLWSSNLRCCLVTSTKCPIRIDGTPARPNCEDDFVNIEDLLQCNNLEDYAGVGISVQASKLCAIDVDHCFKQAFDISSGDDRAKDMLSRFDKFAYCEFSFSGTGLRLLFRADIIEDYSTKFYIKNEKQKIEFYQPTKSYRYVTITGRAIANNVINKIPQYVIEDFLEDFMQRPEQQHHETMTSEIETRTFEQLLIETKRMYFKSATFQDLWFSKAPGSGKNESELDFQIIARLYESVTQDKSLLKQLFEASPYFKSKDSKHISKWLFQDGRYYNYIYTTIRRTHL